jgi:hypothetical protein
MKNRLTLQSFIATLFVVFFLANNVLAQTEETFTTENGTEIPVKFKSLDPDDINRLNVHVGLHYQAGKLYLGGVSYELPGKLFVRAQFGPKFTLGGNGSDAFGIGTSIEANYFFSRKKSSVIKSTIFAEYVNGRVSKYIMKKELDKRISHGIHLGFINAGIQTPQLLTYNTYVIGYSRLSVKQADFLIGNIKLRKRIQTFHRLNVDLLIHRNIQAYSRSRIPVDNDFPTYGARLYYDGYIPIKTPSGNSKSTIYFTLGLESLVDPDDDWNLDMIFGIGYGRRFL